jgi:hypothetical protein
MKRNEGDRGSFYRLSFCGPGPSVTFRLIHVTIGPASAIAFKSASR